MSIMSATIMVLLANLTKRLCWLRLTNLFALPAQACSGRWSGACNLNLNSTSSLVQITQATSRQHPLDEYYQNLYLKAKMTNAMNAAGLMDTSDEKEHSKLTAADLQERADADVSERVASAEIVISPLPQPTALPAPTRLGPTPTLAGAMEAIAERSERGSAIEADRPTSDATCRV